MGRTSCVYLIVVIVSALLLSGGTGRGERGGQETASSSSLTEAPSKHSEAKSATRPAPDHLTLDLGNGVSMKLVRIPAGTFTMGSPASEAKRSSDEGPQHRVTISKPFYMGVYEVTQDQYQAVIGKNPSNPPFKGAKNPVEMVSWNDAAAFCKVLSRKTGKAVRLPTEAEWEYACRAGTTTPVNTGQTISSDHANYNGNYTYGNGRKGSSRGKTIAVGSFKPNAFGLYDMHGNVWEWCQDWYERYANTDAIDPTGPISGSNRVLRGGGWGSHPASCRSACRNGNTPVYCYYFSGFRVVVSPGPVGLP